ncbi:hypothetical protein Tco_1369491 [Tanacetum coccineum]
MSLGSDSNGTQRSESPKERMVYTGFLPSTTQEEHLLMKKRGKSRTLSSKYLRHLLITSKESLEKGYDKEFQTPTHLDALGAGVSNEDQNHKFRDPSLPAWDSLAMTMRTKKNIDTLSIDDLYNNLSVFEQDNPKEHHLLPLHLENVLFLSQAKASSSKHQPSHCLGSYTSYTTSSSKATTTATPDLDQIDDLDLEEMDINWQIAMTAIKIKKFYKKIGRRPRVEWKKQSAIQKGSLGRVSVRGHDFISSQWRTEKEAYDDQLMKSDQLG